MEDVPDPEVGERASRRTYTARYKLEILAEYERLDKAEKGALLRREGLYTSLISAWREQRDKGALAAMMAVVWARLLSDLGAGLTFAEPASKTASATPRRPWAIVCHVR